MNQESDKWVDKGQIRNSSLAFDDAGKPCKNEIRISNERFILGHVFKH